MTLWPNEELPTIGFRGNKQIIHKEETDMINNQTERTNQEKIAYLKQRIKELEIELDQLRLQAYSPSIINGDIATQNKAQFEMIDIYDLLDHAKTRLIKLLQQ
jgi:hypothetical protein